MDADLLTFERIANAARCRRAWRRHWWQLGTVMGAMALFVGYLIIDTWRSTGQFMWPLMIWAAVSFSLTISASLLLGRHHGQRYSKLVTPGPWSSGQIHSTASVAEIARWLGGELAARGFHLARLDRTRVTAVGRGLLHHRSNYQIDVRPSAQRPGHRVITITSWPAARSVIHDFCGSERTVSELLRAVPGGVVLPARTPPARPPASGLGPA